MSAIHLALDIPCTRDDAARLFAVLIFLAQLETDPDAKPGPELDATFGANAREALLGIIGHPVPLGIDCRYDPVTNLLSVTDVEAGLTFPPCRCFSSGFTPTSCRSPTRPTPPRVPSTRSGR